MTSELEKKSRIFGLAELSKLFGPPPVLGTEDANAYERLLQGMIHCYAPQDFMEQWLIKQLADNMWEIKRYTRHKPLAVERKSRQLAEFEAKRVNAREQHRQARVPRPESDGTPASDFTRMMALEDKLEGVVEDVDALLLKPEVELRCNRALEGAAVYYSQLDDWLNNAFTRQKVLLDQLEQYRKGLVRRQRAADDDAIYAILEEVAGESAESAPPLAPANKAAT
jgi:hypothetical protein